MGYQSEPPESSKVISLRLDINRDKELKAIAKGLGLSKNGLINKALDHYLAMLKDFGAVKPN